MHSDSSDQRRLMCVVLAQSEARTYPDLLQDAHDEDVLEYFLTHEIVTVKVGTTTSQ